MIFERILSLLYRVLTQSFAGNIHVHDADGKVFQHDLSGLVFRQWIFQIAWLTSQMSIEDE